MADLSCLGAQFVRRVLLNWRMVWQVWRADGLTGRTQAEKRLVREERNDFVHAPWTSS